MKPILHFVGFRGEEYRRATKIFGLPDMIHRFLDPRAVAEFAKGDTVVYANGTEHDNRFQPYRSLRNDQRQKKRKAKI